MCCVSRFDYRVGVVEVSVLCVKVWLPCRRVDMSVVCVKV